MKNYLMNMHGTLERTEKPQITLFQLFVDCVIGGLLWVLIIHAVAGFFG